MVTARRKAPQARYDDLIGAARKVFLEKGLAKATVSDIVRAAGVAQGTFYLYFATKDDVVNALAERMVEEMVSVMEAATAAAESGALAKLAALRDAIVDMIETPGTGELAEVYHRPENRAVHERMAERMTTRLATLVEGIISEGVGEGVFSVEDQRVAAWFIVGGLRMIDVGFTDMAELPAAIDAAMACALRTLGATAQLPAYRP